MCPLISSVLYARADIPLSFPLPDELHFDSDESARINSDAAILGSLCLRFLQNKYLFAERSVVLAAVERSGFALLRSFQ